jgi:LPS sulfotransferase NodH
MTDTLAGLDLDALLRELGNVEPGDEYRTAREWATLLGVGIDRAKRVLRQAQAAGRLRVTRVYRPAIDGTRRNVPVYAIDTGR